MQRDHVAHTNKNIYLLALYRKRLLPPGLKKRAARRGKPLSAQCPLSPQPDRRDFPLPQPACRCSSLRQHTTLLDGRGKAVWLNGASAAPPLFSVLLTALLGLAAELDFNWVLWSPCSVVLSPLSMSSVGEGGGADSFLYS